MAASAFFPLAPALSLLGHGGASITSGIANSLATAIVKTIYEGLVKVEESLVASLVNDVLNSIVKATTEVSGDDGKGWFATIKSLAPVAELVVGPLLFAATIGAIFHQDMRRLARAWCLGLPVAALGGFAAVKLTGEGLAATDALSNAVIKQVAPHMKADFVKAISAGLASGATPVALLLSLVVVVGGLLLWLELAVRAIAIEIAVFFMPLALAGVVWPATAHFAKRFVALLASLLLLKPVVVGALGLGTAAITTGQGSSAVTGPAVLLIAAFAPVALFKMVPLVDAASVAHVHELSRQPVRAAERALQGVMAFSANAKGATASPPGGGKDLGVASTLLGQAGGGGHGAGSDDHPLGPARPPSPGPPGPSSPTPSSPTPGSPSPGSLALAQSAVNGGAGG